MYRLYVSCGEGARTEDAAHVIDQLVGTPVPDDVAVIAVPADEMSTLVLDAPDDGSVPEILLEAIVGGEMAGVIQTTAIDEIADLLTRMAHRPMHRIG